MQVAVYTQYRNRSLFTFTSYDYTNSTRRGIPTSFFQPSSSPRLSFHFEKNIINTNEQRPSGAQPRAAASGPRKNIFGASLRPYACM